MNWLLRLSQTTAKYPWQMTRDEFIKHHNTGFIPSSAYSNDPYDLSKVKEIAGLKSKYPILAASVLHGDMNLEFRQSGEHQRYVKTDDEGEIIRDEKGMALYLSDEEAEAKGLETKDPTMHIFANDVPIGWVGESFGATELFVADEMQKQGIGTLALKLWLQMYPFRANQTRTLGQMTSAGESTAVRAHEALVRDAVEEGQDVPEEVRRDYY